MAGDPQPKPGRRPKRRYRGRARPEEPLAWICAAADVLPQVCTGRPVHRHHVLRRGQGGTDDASNTRDLCEPCHAWIHAHPTEAVALGYLRRSTTQEAS